MEATIDLLRFRAPEEAMSYTSHINLLHTLCSLYGILGITDNAIEELAQQCSGTLHTLDVNGCVNIKVGCSLFRPSALSFITNLLKKDETDNASLVRF